MKRHKSWYFVGSLGELRGFDNFFSWFYSSKPLNSNEKCSVPQTVSTFHNCFNTFHDFKTFQSSWTFQNFPSHHSRSHPKKHFPNSFPMFTFFSPWKLFHFDFFCVLVNILPFCIIVIDSCASHSYKDIFWHHPACLLFSCRASKPRTQQGSAQEKSTFAYKPSASECSFLHVESIH